MATSIKIDSEQFIYDSLKRNAAQMHITDDYDVSVFEAKEIPAKIKKLVSKEAGADFLTGAKSKFVTLKAKDSSKVKDEDKIKIAKFVKTVFFISDSSEFSYESVVQIGGTEDKEKEDESKDVFFFVKMEMIGK